MRDPNYFLNVRKEILPLVLPAKRCLELGCASGRTLEWLKQQGLIEWAGGIELERNLEMSPLDFFQSGDIEDVDFPVNLDAVLCLDILEHLKNPEAVVAKLRNALRTNGYIIASLPNIGNYRVVLPLLFGRWQYTDWGILDRTHLRFFDRASAIGLFENAGFQVDRVLTNEFGRFGRPMRYLTFNKVPMFHFQYLIRARKIE